MFREQNTVRYLVTGAGGFLGRHFLAALATRGVPTRAMVHAGHPCSALPGDPEVVPGELLSPSTLEPAVEGITHVIHLASRVHIMQETASDPEKAFREINVDGTAHLLAAAARAGATHFLLPSTVKILGEASPGILDETSPPCPTTPFARSKYEAENHVLSFAREHGVHATVLRLAMVYGPGNKGNMMRLLEAAATGRRLPLGRVNNQRCMAYVDHVVQAGLQALDRPEAAGETFLVADAKAYSTREIYAEICRGLGVEPLLKNMPVWMLRCFGCVGSALSSMLRRPMPISRHGVRQLVDDLRVSTDKLANIVGCRPTVELAEGLRRTTEWYQQGCPPVPTA